MSRSYESILYGDSCEALGGEPQNRHFLGILCGRVPISAASCAVAHVWVEALCRTMIEEPWNLCY